MRFVKKEIFESSWKITENRMRDLIKLLNRKRPKFLRGYSGTIYRLAKFIDQNDINLELDLTGVSVTAGPLLGFERDTIEKAFRCEIFDQYGSGEVHSLGFECEHHAGLHIPIERVYIEFLDLNEDVAISEGEQGRIIVTSLENYGMPIIRYDTGDLGAIKEEFCSCGRRLPIMSSVVGRKNDLIRLPHGEIISWGIFIGLMLDMDWTLKYGLNQFQIVQKKENYIIIKIESQKRPESQDLEIFQNFIKNRIGDIDIKFEFVDRIPISASGKRKFVISEVSPGDL